MQEGQGDRLSHLRPENAAGWTSCRRYPCRRSSRRRRRWWPTAAAPTATGWEGPAAAAAAPTTGWEGPAAAATSSDEEGRAAAAAAAAGRCQGWRFGSGERSNRAKVHALRARVACKGM